MPGRLIVISNRIPTGDAPSGGLVVALHDTLEARECIWIGSHPEEGPEEGLFRVGTAPCERLAFRLSKSEYRNYYLGFSNSVLWPLCHRRGDLVKLDREFEAGFLAVNRRIARMVAGILRPDDKIWIHDYHLLPLAGDLRRLGVTNRIGFFLHIPFPALGDLAMLPSPRSFADWIAAYDLVGLQTRADTARCLEMFRSDPRAEFMRDGTVKYGERQVAIRSFPIGIDVESFARSARTEAPNPFGSDEPSEFIIGVDRLDYTKGLPNRFRAFGAYLDQYADGRRPCLVQIAPPTREEVDAYRQITAELEEISGQVNGRHAELDWTPIRYIHRSVDRECLALLYRRAAACLVTSLADGMNLVAKEFVAAQDPDDPGVLVLSRFAGAAEDMTEALLVNPYDVSEMAEAIDRALSMPLAERRARHDACLAAVRATDVSHWSQTYLNALNRCVPTLAWPRARLARTERREHGIPGRSVKAPTTA
ncbi:alpha,alpha-trehalose-phosphate synthase (UDP-forming) [Pseudooceanicola sp.]|uniref:alpha,alpha-trehalose-phosphate synthase (UDP-forming) n=1 Tax=Pseudooceanicola sp. TaxID=1914328 RepID=UPI0040596CCD